MGRIRFLDIPAERKKSHVRKGMEDWEGTKKTRIGVFVPVLGFSKQQIHNLQVSKPLKIGHSSPEANLGGGEEAAACWTKV